MNGSNILPKADDTVRTKTLSVSNMVKFVIAGKSKKIEVVLVAGPLYIPSGAELIVYRPNT